MASTGTHPDQKRVMTSTTSFGEGQRTSDAEHGTYAAPRGTGSITGIITEVHPEKMFIKATTIPGDVSSKGTPLGNGKWIPVMHTAQDVSDRFGEMRTGMTTLVTQNGNGDNAHAVIIGDVGEGFLEFWRSVKVAVSSWRIFQ